MKDDAGGALARLGSFKPCASPSISLGIDTPGDTKSPGGTSRSWRDWCQRQPPYVWCVALVLTFTLLFSSVLVTEQRHMSSFLGGVGASFKLRHQDAEGLSVQGPPVECNATAAATAAARGNSTAGEVAEDVPSLKSCYAQVDKALPRGIIVPTTDLQFRSLVKEDEQQVQKAMTKNLLAMAVGIKQKQVVDEIVQKFPLKNFTIMLFHYDGIVDQWQDLAWSNQSIHVVALHQTKWWFAKRFMHPDIVDQYNYIFIWDEDLGVRNFHVDRYLEIMESEGLEISQPALDPMSLVIHHQITRRLPRLTLHKFVEVMAPVFSKAAWKCAWHMLQNDLVHGWGIDFKIGYCAQGLRNEKVGVIDAEYILHKGIPSLGGLHASNLPGPRLEVRTKAANEMVAFQLRWTQAANEDAAWVDPYKQYVETEKWFTMYRASPPGKKT